VATWSYPSSWTDICNQALSRVGSKPINNVTTDSTDQAVCCRMFLGDAIDAVLGEHDWRGASKRAQLARLDETPVYGFAYAYQLPSDCVRPYAPDTGGSTVSIEGEKLLTDAEEVYLTYVARPFDPTTLPPYLRRAIQAQLAVLLALPLTSSEQTAARVEALFEEDMGAAVTADGDRRDEETLAESLGHTWHDELR
jgi:hypothetical protein